MGGYDERDRLGALRDSIERDEQIPDYIKELKLIVVNKVSNFAINIANNAVGNIELAYWREHSDFKKQAKKIERLRKALEKYGTHLFNCGLNKEGYIESVCTCGFEQVLKGK